VSAGHDSLAQEARFERALARDRSLLLFFNRATLAASVFTVAVLLILGLAMGRISPWLVGLTFYSAGTRLCVFVSRYALGLPLFLLELDSNDPSVRAAARAVFERHRETVATVLLTQGNQRPSAEQVRDLDPDEAAAIARSRELTLRRRNGIVCASLWIAISVAVWTTLVVTGGGPTSLTGSRS
jgi:hypothetical protein